MAKRPALKTPAATFRIVGLHTNIRNVYLMQTGRSYDLDALTEAQANELVAIGWKHIRMIPN